MPFLDDVKDLMHQRLEADNPQALTGAGNVWTKLPLGHYYLREDVADIVGAEIAMQAAALDNVQLSAQVLQLLQKDIGLNTVVDDAITRVFIAAMPPEPL